MPTVAVYVPADLYRRLGSSDDRVRELSRSALEREAGLGSGEVARASFSPVAEAAASLVPSPGLGEEGVGAPPVADGDGASSPVRTVSVSEPPAPAPSSRKCPADTPRGTRCKLCGEKH